MTRSQTDIQTKTAKIQTNYLLTFFATMGGVVVGVLASLAMMGPMIKAEVASATQDASKNIAAAPVRALACTAPADEESGEIAGAFTSTSAHRPASMGGRGADMPAQHNQGNNNPGNPGPHNTWVAKLIGGSVAKTNAHISNTGPNSDNHVTTTNTTTTTVSNTNNVAVENVNVQTGKSGDAVVAGNTNGGSATSGHVSNEYESSTSISITN